MSAVEVYRKTSKVPDLFWNAYVCRPIAAVFVDLLKGSRVTPNQITLVSLVVGVTSAGLLIALPGTQGLVIAVLVFQASYVLDCMDGMLARWRGIQSTPGHLLDFLMDELKAFCILAAASARLFHERADARFLLLGLFGLVALASGIALTTFIRRPEINTQAAPSQAGSRSLVTRLIGWLERGARFLIHYPSYITYVAVAGHIEYYLYPYAAVNALYALRAFSGVALRFGRS
ncbi:MAG TPA: CDP-alcohol phosphatidyltransferase family protein [Polyangiaceae bacterium]|jgi:phosphatidylglycerophosphate synthase